MRAVQNHSCQDWDAVGVPELEGGSWTLPPALLMFTTFMTEFFLLPLDLSWSWAEISKNGLGAFPLKVPLARPPWADRSRSEFTQDQRTPWYHLSRPSIRESWTKRSASESSSYKVSAIVQNLYLFSTILCQRTYPFPGYSPFFGELAHNMLIYCQEIILMSLNLTKCED